MKKKKAALYARSASPEGAEQSIDMQLAELKAYKEMGDYDIVGEYADIGVSGSTSMQDRPSMRRLMADSAAGKVDVIFVTKLDRLFRSMTGHNELESLRKTHGVKWMAIHDHISSES